jgi:SAM-dependent methyltransferase
MAIANHEQADHWNNSDDVGHWVSQQDRYDGMLAPFTDIILDGAALTRTDRVLDVGCGCGATTLAAARVTSDGHAHGVDLSAAMLERARSDAERVGLRNTSFEQADVQVHPFGDDAFDAVVSRFGTMFFSDAVAAFTNVRRTTRSDGRVAFVCWQPMVANEWMTVPAAALAQHAPLPAPGPRGAPGMFAFADPDDPRRVLETAGWRAVSIEARPTSMLVGGRGTLDDAVDFLRTGYLARTMLAGVDPDTEAAALRSLRTALAPYEVDEGVRLGAAVWLVTARS